MLIAKIITSNLIMAAIAIRPCHRDRYQFTKINTMELIIYVKSPFDLTRFDLPACLFWQEVTKHQSRSWVQNVERLTVDPAELCGSRRRYVTATAKQITPSILILWMLFSFVVGRKPETCIII